jgi:hypothetical protein
MKFVFFYDKESAIRIVKGEIEEQTREAWAKGIEALKDIKPDNEFFTEEIVLEDTDPDSILEALQKAYCIGYHVGTHYDPFL